MRKSPTQTLRRMILSGELAPGARLNQADLAGRLGVSRIPVRDALQALSGEGLVRLNGRSGAWVTDMSVSDLQELYEMRGALEPLASHLAMPNVGRAQVLRMRELHELMESTDDNLAWLEANTAFHALVYERSNRPRMIAAIGNLRRQTDRYLHLHLAVIGETDHLAAEHAEILGAVERGDALRVESLTRTHLATSHDFILRYLLELGVSADPTIPDQR